MDAEKDHGQYETFERLLKRTSHLQGVDKDMEISNEDVLLLPYSSGTTGTPKGVMITSGNLKAHILQLAVDDFGYYIPAVSGIIDNRKMSWHIFQNMYFNEF